MLPWHLQAAANILIERGFLVPRDGRVSVRFSDWEKNSHLIRADFIDEDLRARVGRSARTGAGPDPLAGARAVRQPGHQPQPINPKERTMTDTYPVSEGDLKLLHDGSKTIEEMCNVAETLLGSRHEAYNVLTT